MVTRLEKNVKTANDKIAKLESRLKSKYDTKVKNKEEKHKKLLQEGEGKDDDEKIQAKI